MAIKSTHRTLNRPNRRRLAFESLESRSLLAAWPPARSPVANGRRFSPPSGFIMGTRLINALMFRAAIFLLGIVVFAAAARAVTYTATSLHPAGFTHSRALGISGTKQVGWGSGSTTGNRSHALLWSGTAASLVDLHPAGFFSSTGTGVSGASQVGYGTDLATGDDHALLWTGTATSAVDLHPADPDRPSFGFGVSGASQVGQTRGFGFGAPRAYLWTGTAASGVNLHPVVGFSGSTARGVSGATQVGYGSGSATGNYDHALLWSGTATSAVDLHPAGFNWSTAEDVSGGIQVGSASHSVTISGDRRATLWRGTAASAVDLHPAGFASTAASGVSGAGQVGNGRGTATGDNTHALFWNGTAASVVDLHPFLSGLGLTFTHSYATDIDENGSIVGFATSGGRDYAVLWSPETAVPGDFNDNGTVDAADYVVWRKTDSTQNGYDTWRANFGRTVGAASGSGATVPEPATVIFFVLAMAIGCWRRRPLASRVPKLVGCDTR